METITIQILKNDNPIKSISVRINQFQKTFHKFVDIAGGMYNGKDKFTVKSF
ncbi:MAG: hypothetical protein IPO78_17285 [Saprospiraceae bacterium]|nr:hypothetical protein [Saprospiraceae bacterium]